MRHFGENISLLNDVAMNAEIGNIDNYTPHVPDNELVEISSHIVIIYNR